MFGGEYRHNKDSKNKYRIKQTANIFINRKTKSRNAKRGKPTLNQTSFIF